MSRLTGQRASRDYRGMARTTQLSLIAGIAVLLTLVSSVSFAAWTATATKTATATAGTTAVSTADSNGGASITALGPFTYSTQDTSVTKPITIRNTGTVSEKLDTVAITRSGTLGDGQISITLWAGTSATCSASTPVVTAPLSDNTVADLSSLNITVAGSSSAILCASTTFTGDVAAQSARTATVKLSFTARAGANWAAADSLSANNRSFTQSIALNTSPNAPSAIRCETHNNQKIATVSWTAPAGFQSPNSGYKIYFNGVFNRTTTSTSVELAEYGVNAQVTVRAVSLDGAESVDSAAVAIVSTDKGNGGSVCGP